MKKKVTICIFMVPSNRLAFHEGIVESNSIDIVEEHTIKTKEPLVRLTLHNKKTLIVKGTVEDWLDK